MTDNLEVDREFVVIKVLLLRVCVYNMGDNKGTIYRMNHRGHFRDLRLSTQEDAIKEVVRNCELKDFMVQNATSSSQRLRGIDKGKQKVRGIIHVIIGINEE
ncbi:hypothetical protein J1N35_040683 [Gossypium stocksii]|uniref:Uncharacterized protein n=1 Tax=Gossypium stocksii TaxID=47602 RepID=A0A9D3UE63_9ROSI|nr:hypothetical protein J1N35_040683 [Gossypium stocksii]